MIDTDNTNLRDKEQADDPLCYSSTCKHRKSSHQGEDNQGSCIEGCICNEFWDFKPKIEVKDGLGLTEPKKLEEHKSDGENTTNAQTSSQQQKEEQLEAVIYKIKEEFKAHFVKFDELVKQLGKAIEQAGIVKKKDISREIKIRLQEEIDNERISARTIDRYCPDEWKHITKPKKKDILSFSEQEENAQKQRSRPLNEEELSILSKWKQELKPTSQQEGKPVQTIAQTVDGGAVIIEESAPDAEAEPSTSGHGDKSPSEMTKQQEVSEQFQPSETQLAHAKFKHLQSTDMKDNESLESAEFTPTEHSQHDLPQASKTVTSNEEDVIKSEFRLDWDELSNLYVPNMENVWFNVNINKNTGKIVSGKVRNTLGDEIELEISNDALHLDRDTKVVDAQANQKVLPTNGIGTIELKNGGGHE